MLAADSGRGYNLDVSLFERLVKQRSVPVHALAEQHRMRPEISQLIRSTIYPQLRASWERAGMRGGCPVAVVVAVPRGVSSVGFRLRMAPWVHLSAGPKRLLASNSACPSPLWHALS